MAADGARKANDDRTLGAASQHVAAGDHWLVEPRKRTVTVMVAHGAGSSLERWTWADVARQPSRFACTKRANTAGRRFPKTCSHGGEGIAHQSSNPRPRVRHCLNEMHYDSR
jgi:hypothetical protein